MSKYPVTGGRALRGIVCAAFGFSLLAAVPSFAVDEFQMDLEFIRKLTDVELNDYAQMQLQQMQQKYPAKKDAVNLEKARLGYATGKSAEADKIINSFPQTSEYYDDAILLKAQIAFLRKKFADADAAYKKYFAKQKEAPKGRSAQEEYKKAVMVYSKVLKEMGKGKEAAAILSKLEGIKGIGGDDRQMQFLQLQATIDAEQAKMDNRKPVDVGGLKKILEQMKALQFIRDGVGASAYLQYARGQILLGRNAANAAMASKKPAEFAKIQNFKEAIRTIKMADPFFEELEGTMPKGDRSKSPVAEAMFYKAQAIQYQAIATHFGGNPENGKKQVLGAVKYYMALLDAYPDTDLRSQVMAEHSRCAAFAEKMYGVKLEIAQGDGGEAIDMKIEQAETLFANKDYASCVPIYLEAVRLGRRSRKLPNVVMRLALAYAQLDELLEAEALVSYVSEAMPKEANSAESAYRLGGILYERARKETNLQNQNDLYSRAVNAWNIFVTLDPAHQKAPDVAFAIAEMQYKKGADQMALANAEKDNTKKLALQVKTVQAFYDAIPLYQRLTEVFSAFDKGVRAYYKLGWIYHTLNSSSKDVLAGIRDKSGEPLAPNTNFAVLGAEAFSAYFDEETDASKSDDRLEAKFRAAELTLFGENPVDAVPVFMEIHALYNGKAAEKGIRLNTKTAARIKEDVASYVPWAFDLAGEKVRKPILALKEKQESFRKSTKAMKAVKESSVAELAKLKSLREELAEENKNIAQVAAEASLDFEAMAKGQLKDRIAAAEKMNEAEKAKAMMDINTAIKNQLAALEKQKGDTLAGDQTAIDEGMPQLEAAKTEAERILAAAAEEIKGVEKEAADATAEFEQVKKKADELRGKIKAAEKLVVEAEAEKERVEAASQEEDDPKLKEAIEKLNAAYKQKAEVVTDDNNKLLEGYEASLTRLQLAGEEAREKLLASQAELAIAKENATIAADRIGVAKRRRNLNEKSIAALAKKGEERKVLIPDLVKGAKGLTDAQTALAKKSAGALDLREKEIQRKVKAAELRIAAADKEIAALDEQIKPIQAEVDALKNKAAVAFEQFLKAFPASTKAPDNMARLGTIYMDLGQNEKATAVLGLLQKNFPDSKASKTATFNLGRAQYDAGKMAEAAKSFEDLFAVKGAADSLPVSNLVFLVDAGMKMGSPKVTVAAAQKLMTIAKDKNRQGEVTAQRCEQACIRAGEAFLAMKDYRKAQKCIEDLFTRNEKTGYFYDAKFILAEAKLHNGDAQGAEMEYDEILRYASDKVVTNKALCLLADALVKSGVPAKEQVALSRYQLVATLGDASSEECRPWIEKAYLGYATLLKKAGKTADIEKALAKYKKDFPQGVNIAAISKLLK